MGKGAKPKKKLKFNKNEIFIVTYFGIAGRKIFSKEPTWLVDAINDGQIWLDESISNSNGRAKVREYPLFVETTEHGRKECNVGDNIFSYFKDGKRCIDTEKGMKDANL